MKKLAILALSILFLAGCAKKEGPFGGHNEEWYSHHVSQACQQAKWCDNHPNGSDNSYSSTENCSNARLICANHGGNS